MIKKKGFIVLAVICVATMLMASFSAAEKPKCPHPPAPVTLSGPVTIAATTVYPNGLIIADDAVISVPDGDSLTMTVNGVETPIAAGTYWGNIVLTVTEQIVEVCMTPGPFHPDTESWRTALYVEDGAVVPGKSVLAAVVGGKVTDTYAKNNKITSVGPQFNGIIATNSGYIQYPTPPYPPGPPPGPTFIFTNTTPYPYTIDNPKINFTGYGGDDFSGFAAGIAAKGNSNVTVNHARIITNGALRSAIYAGDNSTLQVNDSYAHTANPPLPDFVVPDVPDGMWTVPWMLGITGTCRATLTTGNVTAYYNNSHIVADAWGVLSTDAVQNVKLYATNSLIEAVESGYGSYADGNSLNTFSRCIFNVHDYALIMTAGSGVFTDGTVVNSGRFGVMMHSGGLGTLTIDKGSVFNTKETVIQAKSSYPTIVVDNAYLHSESGVILDGMFNDDPGMNGLCGGGGGGGGPAPTPRPLSATFSNMELDGDIVSSMTTLEDMNVAFTNATIKGAISTAMRVNAISTLIPGDPNLCTLPAMPMIYSPEGEAAAPYIGEGVNTYCDPGDPYGLTVSLDQNSKWVVDKTSYLTGLTIADGAIVTAPKCYSVTMTVDTGSGPVITPIEPGTYTGKIVLTIAQSADHCHHHGH